MNPKITITLGQTVNTKLVFKNDDARLGSLEDLTRTGDIGIPKDPTAVLYTLDASVDENNFTPSIDGVLVEDTTEIIVFNEDLSINFKPLTTGKYVLNVVFDYNGITPDRLVHNYQQDQYFVVEVIYHILGNKMNIITNVNQGMEITRNPDKGFHVKFTILCENNVRLTPLEYIENDFGFVVLDVTPPGYKDNGNMITVNKDLSIEVKPKYQTQDTEISVLLKIKPDGSDNFYLLYFNPVLKAVVEDETIQSFNVHSYF